MKHYILGDVVDVISERENDPSLSGYERFVGLKHYVSGDVEIKKYGTTENLNSSMKVFKSGDILVARRNVYLKRASVVYFDGLTSGDSIVLRAKNENIGRVLPFILNTSEFWDYANQHSDGTMSKRLSPKVLKAYEFDLPDDNELEELADLLWSLVDTKNAYEELLIKTDELVKSQFIEMFDGRSDIDKVLLKDAFDLQMGKTPARAESKLWQSKDHKWISIADMSTYGKYTGDTKEYLSDIAIKSTGIKIVPQNTVIMSFKLTIGRTAITSEDIYTNEAIMAFIPKMDLFDINYLRFALHYFNWESGVQNAVKGATLNKKIIGNTEFGVPSIEEQISFVEFAEQSDKSKFELQQAIESTDNLIKSILYSNLEEKKE